MNIKNIFLTIVIAGIVSVIAVSAIRSEKTQTNPVVSQQGIQGVQGPKGNDGYTPVKGKDYFDGKQGPKGESGAIGMPQKLGALASPDIPYNWFSFGDVRRFAYTQTLNQASTTVCSFLSPASTSTLISASLQITTGTTTQLLWDIAKSTVPDATTTAIGTSFTVASNKQATIVASTTPTAEATTIEPSRYLNFKYGGANGSLNVLVGTCKATFEVN